MTRVDIVCRVSSGLIVRVEQDRYMVVVTPSVSMRLDQMGGVHVTGDGEYMRELSRPERSFLDLFFRLTVTCPLE